MKSDMRVILTKRLLREGFLRCLEKKTADKITISDLCKESGVNRTTFYNHYQQPIQILNDMALEYSLNLRSILNENMADDQTINEAAIEKCCQYLYKNSSELKILLSENADSSLKRMATEILSEMADQSGLSDSKSIDKDSYRLYVRASGAAAYELIRCWIIEEIEKTPEEIVSLLKRAFGTLSI